MKKVKAKAASVLLASAMALSLSACGNSDDKKDDKDSSADTTTEATTGGTEGGSSEATTEEPAKVIASIDFEDENYAFAAVSKGSGKDKSELSIVDFAGSKALKMTNTEGNNMFLAINVSALLGDNVANLSTISIDIGTENTDGSEEFFASSGFLYAYTGEDNAEVKCNAWSVYLDTANPKTATFDVSGAGFVAGQDNFIIISKETDNASSAQNIYIDNIAFLDASGATLTADSSAEFGNPSGFASAKKDRMNLFGISNAITIDGFAGASDAGWAQGPQITLTDEQLAALEPGSVIEIDYTSESGNIWIVLPAAKQWQRIGDGTIAGGDGSTGFAYINGSGNIAQITYEQIAAVLGEDKAAWGNVLQCEADTAWSVNSVKIGKQSDNIAAYGGVSLGMQSSDAGWAQGAQFTLTPEQQALLVPGSVFEIDYTSESGEIWMVFPGAAQWQRIGDGTIAGGDGSTGTAICTGSKAYIPFEMVAAVLGDDPTAWGNVIQCEASTAWSVTDVKISTAAKIKTLNNFVNVDGFAGASDAGWAQGPQITLTDEQIAALVPGSVIEVQYTSESGEIWLVFPAAAQWQRIGDGTIAGGDGSTGWAICQDGTAQIPFETIAAVLGDDPKAWGNVLQCESSTAWSVTSLRIGTSSGAGAAAE